MKPRMRVLREAERWGRPYFNRTLGATIKVRVRCGAPNYGCVANATVAVGTRKFCRTHARIHLEGRL